MSPEQEHQVCDSLVNLGWMSNDHALHAEGGRLIRELLLCSADEAKAILHDLRSRNLIDVTMARPAENASWEANAGCAATLGMATSVLCK